MKEIQTTKFWDDWTLADFSKVDKHAFGQIIPKVVILLVVTVVDFALQVRGSKKGTQGKS
jgi:hypothetical protein